MKTLAFVATVSKEYYQFIPFYIYFLKQSYPEHDIILYVENKKIVNEILDFYLKEKYEYEIREIKRTINNPQIYKYYRWVISDNIWYNYRYLYFDDIDIMHVPEKPSLLEYHIEHMRQLTLPYSNYLRYGTNRLSGLHFVDTQVYYPLMKEIMAKYMRKMHSESILKERNEVMLYRMVEESQMGVAPYDSRFEFHRHHGMHLRLFDIRNKKKALQHYTKESSRYRDNFFNLTKTNEFINLIDHGTKQIKTYFKNIFEVDKKCKRFSTLL